MTPQAITVTDPTPQDPAAPAEPDARRIPHVRYPTTLAGQPALVLARDAGRIAARLYPDVAPVLRAAAAVQVRAHLAHLAQQGLVDGNAVDGGTDA